MRRARDVREQIEGLMTRVEIEMTSNPLEDVAIRKVLVWNVLKVSILMYSNSCIFVGRQSPLVIITTQVCCQKEGTKQ